MKVKVLLIIVIIVSSFSVQAQKKIKLFLGSGFMEDECTLYVTYALPKAPIIDTIFKKEKVSTNLTTGHARTAEISYPKGAKVTLHLIINNIELNSFTFQDLKNNSELLLDYGGPWNKDKTCRNYYINYNLLQEKHFSFY